MAARQATVRMWTQIHGTRNGQPWPARGDMLTCSADEAQDLIAAALAGPTNKPLPTTADRARPTWEDDFY